MGVEGRVLAVKFWKGEIAWPSSNLLNSLNGAQERFPQKYLSSTKNKNETRYPYLSLKIKKRIGPKTEERALGYACMSAPEKKDTSQPCFSLLQLMRNSVIVKKKIASISSLTPVIIQLQ